MTPKKTVRRGAERRQTPRADARLSMRLEGEHENGARAQIVTESQNISCSGVYCYSSHYLAALSKVDLTIVLPQMPDRKTRQELVKCEGIVVRCEATQSRSPVRQFELACMFHNLDAEQRERIEAFVTWRNIQTLRAAARTLGTVKVAQRSRAAAAAPRRTAGKTARKRASRRAVQ
jgi:c-di-GMP-binding flagellar brake protein YcgR